VNNNEVVMRENNPKMVPIPREYSPDFWSFDPEDSIELTCLMPNGIVILLKVSYNATLSDIKEVCLVKNLFFFCTILVTVRISGMRLQNILYMESCTTCLCTFSRALIAWQNVKNFTMSQEEFVM
jgi:hypothetical protein